MNWEKHDSIIQAKILSLDNEQQVEDSKLFWNKMEPKIMKPSSSWRWIGIAAAIVLLISTGSYFLSNNETISTTISIVKTNANLPTETESIATATKPSNTKALNLIVEQNIMKQPLAVEPISVSKSNTTEQVITKKNLMPAIIIDSVQAIAVLPNIIAEYTSTASETIAIQPGVAIAKAVVVARTKRVVHLNELTTQKHMLPEFKRMNKHQVGATVLNFNEPDKPIEHSRLIPKIYLSPSYKSQ